VLTAGIRGPRRAQAATSPAERRDTPRAPVEPTPFPTPTMNRPTSSRLGSAARAAALTAAALLLTAVPRTAGDLPPFDEVAEGFEPVGSSAVDGGALYALWVRRDDAQVLAELPAGFEEQRLFLHNVVSRGNPLAGVGILMSNDRYVHWRRIGDKLALIAPELATRASGEAEDERSLAEMYTDRVLLSVPVVADGPGGGPLIDLDELFVKRAAAFFGPLFAGADAKLATLTKVKAFPHNVEIAFELPLGANPPGGQMFGVTVGGPGNAGRLTEIHYSISVLPEDTGYEPRAADPRLGYFKTTYNDLSRTTREDETYVRHITRWHLEKADPSLRLSPPKRPIVWYIEHTTPLRYRRYIRDALLEWNRAFERIGIVDAVEVRQQDASTGAYMDIDPEDIRYAFVRWNNSQAPFAIGPSRVDPTTGQIIDADLTLNAGIFAVFASRYRTLLPLLAVEGLAPETLAWLDEHPRWDPRLRLASPEERAVLSAQRAARTAAGVVPDYGRLARQPLAALLVGDPDATGLGPAPAGVECLAGVYTALGNDLMRLVAAADAADEGDADAPREDLLDGLPESYVEAVVRWVTAHEAGHCLGLAHNFMGSTVYSLDEINSADFPADQGICGSVMEYCAPNVNVDPDAVQGQWMAQHLGPYDFWAIEYGYGIDVDLDEVLAEASQPEHVYGSNVDMVGADPRVRTYDLGSDPLEFVEHRMRLIGDLRARIVDEIVEEGEGWGKARSAYYALLTQHMTMLSIAAGWVGGSYVHKDYKGDADRTPIEDVPAVAQRRALDLVIDNAFPDTAFGLSSDLLYRMSIDRWSDVGDPVSPTADPALNAHDLLIGVQAAAVTMLLNPTTLRRVYDNELRIPAERDALTLPELLARVVDAGFAELTERGRAVEAATGAEPGTSRTVFTARSPMISSLRRNLQVELVDRLIGLSLEEGLDGAVSRPLGSLCRAKLAELNALFTRAQREPGVALDPYTASHLADLRARIASALDARYVRD